MKAYRQVSIISVVAALFLVLLLSAPGHSWAERNGRGFGGYTSGGQHGSGYRNIGYQNINGGNRGYQHAGHRSTYSGYRHHGYRGHHGYYRHNGYRHHGGGYWGGYYGGSYYPYYYRSSTCGYGPYVSLGFPFCWPGFSFTIYP